MFLFLKLLPLFSCFVGNDYTLAHQNVLRDIQQRMGIQGQPSKHEVISKIAKFMSK